MSDGRPAANDQDRLPWLEPYREPSRSRAAAPATAPAAKRSSKGGLLALAAVVGLGGALAGGYWIGQRQAEPTSNVAPVSQPPAPVAQVPMAEPAAPVASDTKDTAVADAAPVVRKAVSKPRRHASARSAYRRPAASPRVRAVAPAPVRVAAAPRVWTGVPSPGPAGQVIQLGAFSHPDRAYAAYKRRIARYPGLGRMPRVIVPVVARDNGQMLYVLRLGTNSRRQSSTVCRDLRRRGNPCVVIG